MDITLLQPFLRKQIWWNQVTESPFPYFRSVSIDFERMRVIEKSLQVRRLDDGNTEWAWYVILSSKWTKYGEQVRKKAISYRFVLVGISDITQFNLGIIDFIRDHHQNPSVWLAVTLSRHSSGIQKALSPSAWEARAWWLISKVQYQCKLYQQTAMITSMRKISLFLFHKSLCFLLFLAMQQISKKGEMKRRVTRRPLLRLSPRNSL